MAMLTRKSWNDLTSSQKGALSVAGVVQTMLLVLALVDLRRRPAEQINGSKRLWTMVAFINFVGPISYFLLGRKRS
jgi:hypothetical protein